MPAEADRPIAAVMDGIARLAIALGVVPMTRWPHGWHHEIDNSWTITVNGQKHAITVQIMGAPFDLQPFECVVEYNGWLAGVVTPFGGTLAAGSAANESMLLAAVEKAIEQVKAHA